MDVSSYVLLSHEQALRRRMDVVANNMANISTTGFKRELPLFHEQVRQSAGNTPADAQRVSYVLDFGATHDARAGAFQSTGNALDLMIDGPGYLTVTLPDGQPAYTRAGNLKLLDDGTLATAAGYAVRGEGGGSIVVPPDAGGRIAVLQDGTVSGAGGPIGRITVTAFDDEAALDPRGDGLFDGEGGRELAPADTRLRSGGLEGSNVQPIAETTQMVEILRSYQSSQRMSDSIADMRKQALGRLGRLGN